MYVKIKYYKRQFNSKLTALISKLKKYEAIKFINWRIAVNEIAQLCKSAYDNQLQQSIYLCH